MHICNPISIIVATSMYIRLSVKQMGVPNVSMQYLQQKECGVDCLGTLSPLVEFTLVRSIMLIAALISFLLVLRQFLKI